jgi:hypothetical protein
MLITVQGTILLYRFFYIFLVNYSEILFEKPPFRNRFDF